MVLFKSNKTFDTIKENALQWAFSFDTCCILDSNNYCNYPFHQHKLIVGAGVKSALCLNNTINAFEQLSQFLATHKNEYVFGYFSYDLKNDTEKLTSSLPDYVNFPSLYFFVPQHTLIINSGVIKINSTNDNKIFEVLNTNNAIQNRHLTPIINFKNRTSKNEYLNATHSLQQHILNGTIYEINYCQEFYAEQIKLDPLATFKLLNNYNGGPFSAYFKLKHLHALCTSPERFISKQNNTIISQPIKGTIKKSGDEIINEQLKFELRNNKKELAENVMIVDLVRNDLAKSAVTGSVKANELFGIYEFKTVHQMISTITAEKKSSVSEIEIIKNAFPMGSMTGAPKYTSMQLIEQYEKIKRGLYSGSIGYFTPKRDFDFNVVIRTLLYNDSSKYTSYSTGSAITLDAEAEKEYEECLLKAQSIFTLFK